MGGGGLLNKSDILVIYRNGFVWFSLAWFGVFVCFCLGRRFLRGVSGMCWGVGAFFISKFLHRQKRFKDKTF